MNTPQPLDDRTPASPPPSPPPPPPQDDSKGPHDDAGNPIQKL